MEFKDQNTTDFQYFKNLQQSFIQINDREDRSFRLGRKIPCVEEIANQISHEIA